MKRDTIETAPAWLRGSAALMMLTFDVDAEAPILAEGRRYGEHLMLMSHQAFGPMIGVPRILELLAEFDLRATFFVPGLIADRYPAAVEQMLAGGHEIGHHSYSHRPPTSLTPDEERADFERCLEALTRHGATVRGHRTPLSAASMHTAGLVAEYGLLYESTLMDDDRPYRLDTGSGDIIELPPHWGLDDWLQYNFLALRGADFRIKPPDEVIDGWISELDAMRRYGCLYVLTMHPFCSGRAGRLLGLRRLLKHAVNCQDVEFVTGTEAAQRALADPGLARRALARLDPNPDPSVYPRD